jgi:signal transduction histidine kinase
VPSWLQSPLIRLAWQLPAVTALILIAVLVPTYREAVRNIDAQVRSAVQEEILGLEQAFEEQGLAGLVAVITERVRRPVDPSAVYLLTDRNGLRLAGNLAQWPAGVATTDQLWFSSPETEGTTLDGQVFVLYDGQRLLVARRSPLAAFIEHLRERLALAGALVILGCGVLAAWTLVRYRSRLRQLRADAGAILAGDLSQRLALAGGGDELDQLAAEFNLALTEIERLMDATRHVSSAIAHDMRRPIAALRYRLEELLRRDDVPEPLRLDLESLLSQTDDTLATFASLLRLARLEAGSFGPHRERIDLAALVREAVETYEPVAAAAGLDLRATLAEATVIGDRSLLFQALQNLLENAIKYGRGVIDVALARTDSDVELRVRDHGAGVPAAVLPRLGERFFRADAARSTEGAGIGLALTLAIIRAHGGEMLVTNAEPGLAVVLRLPPAP